MGFVLALEASSRTYATAAGDGERPRAQRVSRRDDPAFTGLGDLVAQTLAESGTAFRDIAAIAVDIGPGGLSSMRAAVAYANGLAFSLGVRIFPITSLELMAIAAAEQHDGPFLCLRRGTGGNTYAGLFGGQLAELRHGPHDSVVPSIAGGLDRVSLAGVPAADVAGLLPGVTITDTGIAEADVTVLYQTARAAMSDPERLVTIASPVNEASLIFHSQAAR